MSGKESKRCFIRHFSLIVFAFCLILPAAYLGSHDFSAALEVEYKTALKFAEKLGLRK